MLLYNSIRGVGSLCFQAKKSGIRQVGFVPPALPLYRGRDLGARHAAKTSFVAWAFLPEIIDTWWWSISFSFWSFQWQTNLSVLQSAQWSLRRESMKSIGCLFDSVLSQVPWALSFFRLQTPFAKLCPIVSDIGQLTKSRPHRECRGFATSVSFVRATCRMFSCWACM